MIKFFRGLIIAVLLIWAVLVALQIDSRLGVGDLIIVFCLGGVYHFLGKIFIEDHNHNDT